MSLLTPRRINTPELLDEHDAPRDDMERSLRDLRWFNGQWGGIRIYARLLRRLMPNRAPTSVLDVGTGTSDLLESLEGVRMRIGVDFKLEHLLDRPPGLPDGTPKVLRVVGDANFLPFRNSAVEVATSAHFFHHFSTVENTGILTEMLRVSSFGVVVNDTRRHYLPLLFVIVTGALRLVGRITRFDAPASVRRGYTVDEARAIAEGVFASKALVVRAFPFRFGILLWK